MQAAWSVTLVFTPRWRSPSIAARSDDRLPEPGQQIDFRGGFLHPLDEKHRLCLSGV